MLAYSQLEEDLIQLGLIDVGEKDPRLIIDLKYSTDSNIWGVDLYGELNHAFLQAEVAEMLINAQDLLESLMPGYCLVVLDAARTRRAQQYMWDHTDLPLSQKGFFVSNPKYGSVHNFGAAVDVSIADSAGLYLDMGAPFDHIGEEAHPVKEAAMLADGLLSSQHIENRKLLRKVMHSAGFFNIQTEWWHFNAMYRHEAREKFPIIE